MNGYNVDKCISTAEFIGQLIEGFFLWFKVCNLGSVGGKDAQRDMSCEI